MKIDLLSETVLTKLRSRVELEDVEDAAQLIADAINVYADLGCHARNGAEFFMKASPDAPLRRLRFPFHFSTYQVHPSQSEGRD